MSHGPANIKPWLDAFSELDSHREGFEETRDFLNDGEHFRIYAVDTDIALCFTTPQEQGPSDACRGNGYGVIFPTEVDDAKGAAAVALTIANHIFFKLNRDWPVLQLPSHHAETEAVFAAIAKRASATHDHILEILSSEENLFQRILNSGDIERALEIRTDENVEQGERSDLPENAQEIVKRLRDYFTKSNKGNPARELRRYLALIAEGALISTDQVSALFVGQPELEPVAQALKGAEDLSGWITEAAAETEWERLIREEKSAASRKIHRIRGDAKAMARLEYVNNQLEPLGGRLIFITGDSSLIAAAKKYSDRDFSRKYIRNFKAFLAPAFWSLKNSNGEKSEGLANDHLESMTWFSESIQKGADKDGDISPVAQTSLENNWRELRDIAFDHDFFLKDGAYDQIAREADRLYLRIQNTNSSIEDLKEELGLLSRKSMDELIKEQISFVDAVATTGVEFLSTIGKFGARNSPFIEFNSYKNASALFKALSRADSILAMDPPLRKLLDDMKEDTHDKEVGANDLGYLHFLVLSAIFGGAGRWQNARYFASIAIFIARRNVETVSGGRVSGREAYYLSAISRRLCATSVEQVNQGLDDLNEARACLASDEKSEDQIKLDEVRFLSEELANRLAYLYLQNNGIKIVSQVKDPIIESISQINDDLFIAQKTPNLPKDVSAKISTNVLQVYALCRINGIEIDGKSADGQFAAKAWENLEALTLLEDDDRVSRSFLKSSYLLFGRCADLGGKRPTKHEIISHYSEMDKYQGSFSRYDKPRYEGLRDFCLSILKI